MEQLIIEGTPTTPEVKFQPDIGKFKIGGRSIPENAVEFYKPILGFIEQYSAGGIMPPTQLDIQLEYYNTASSRCLLDIFKRMDIIKQKGTEVNINWYFEDDDDDMRDAGEYYQTLVNVPFNIKPI